MTDPSADAVAEPPLSALRSAADFHAALRWSVEHALATRSRRLIWLDPDFAGWPLDDPALLDLLTAWLQLPQRRLVLLGQQYAQMQRQHPRFVAWRRNWSHVIDAWAPSDGVEVKMPTLALDDGRLCLQVFDSLQWRGRLALDERAARKWRDEIDALLQRCEAAFPVHHLGL